MAQRHPHRCSSLLSTHQHNDSVVGIATNNNTTSLSSPLPSPHYHRRPPQLTLQNDDERKLFQSWPHCRRRTTKPCSSSSSSSSSIRSKRRLFVASFFLVVIIIILNSLLAGHHANLHRSIGIVDVVGVVNKRSSQSTVTMTDVIHPNHKLLLTSSSEAAAEAANFFNCHHPNSKCTYLNPSTFLHAYYASSLSLSNNNNDSYNYTQQQRQRQQWRKQIGFDNYNLPALDVLSWWSSTTNNNDSYNSASYTKRSNNNNNTLSDTMMQQQYNITYIHIHKCGGTSIQGALYSRARTIRRQQQQQQQLMMKNDSSRSNTMMMRMAKVHTYKYSFGGGSRAKKESRDKARLDYIHSIVTTQQRRRMKSNSSSSSSLLVDGLSIFTIVRDPIERFLSGIQQIMHYNIELRTKCLFEKNTTGGEDDERILRQRTISCAISDIEMSNYRNDVHLQPMMAHFRLLDGEGGGLASNAQLQQHSQYDNSSSGVIISVFAMEDINHVLSHLLSYDNQQQQQKQHNSTIVQPPNDDISSSSSIPTKTIIHARDRSDATYATSPILASLSVNDCTVEMIHRLCALYHVDVEMMRYLGFSGFAVDRCP